MKRFIELKIKASEVKLIELLNNLKKATNSKWGFEKKLSKDYALNISRPENKVACFKANSSKHYEATIWLVINENELRVTNIVSRKVTFLEKDSYNIIVKDFYSEFVNQLVNKDFSVNLTSDEVTIEELANKDTAKKLIQWEALFDHSSGNTHPYDRERWFDFIKTAVDTNSTLTVGDLEQWLTEEKNWLLDEENSITGKIIIDFEYGLDLLRYYVGKNY